MSLILVVAMAPHAVAAQDLDTQPPQDYWVNVIYPKVFYTPRNGLAGGLYLGWIQPLRFDEFFSPPPYRASLSIDGQAATSGSWALRLDARAPLLADQWRFRVRLSGRRRARDNYFGIGNNTEFDDDNVTDAQSHFYQADHTRLLARAEVQRHLFGPLRLLIGVDVSGWEIEPKEGPSVLRMDLAAGVDPTIGRFTSEVAGRFGLVFDTRNDEVQPSRGVFLEAIVSGTSDGFLSEVSYSRFKLGVNGYLPVSERFNLAARVVTQVMGGTPRLGDLYVIDASEDAFGSLGGGDSHRGLRHNRFLGRHTLLGNLEGRYTLYSIPTIAHLSLVGFVDAGRVFEEESFRLTTDDLKVGGGGGLFLRVGRAAVLGFTVGTGPDGVITAGQTRWAF